MDKIKDVKIADISVTLNQKSSGIASKITNKINEVEEFNIANETSEKNEYPEEIRKYIPEKYLKDKNYKSLHVSIKDIDIKSMSEEEKIKFFDKKNQELKEELSACTNTREKITTAAKFLATKFPKLPYFWGGGHELSYEQMLGINYNLGQDEKIIYGGANDYQVGDTYPYSYDCSGFVSWCLINGGFSKIDKVLGDTGLAALGEEKVSITSENIIDRVKPGDLATQNGHIGIVIGVDKEKNEIAIAHVSGSGKGMNITTQSTETGLITKDDVGLNYSGNIESKSTDKPYFTDIVLMNYD